MDKERLDRACPAAPAELSDRAQVYGQATALSGDHVDDPTAFFNEKELRNALSTLQYATKALENASHFHPSVRGEWIRYHNQALGTRICLASG